VVVLGFDAVTHLALASSVFRTLSEQRQFALDPQDFWLHAFGAGKAAQLLAEEIDGEEEPGCCFTAGLLHDVGKYVMALVLGERYQGIVERAAAEGCFLREAELAELGLDHADVGQWLAERWHFPPRLADCIGYHYKPARYRGPYASEVRVVAASSELSRASGFGNAGEPESKSAEVSEIPALGLTRDRLAALTETLSALHGEARRFLGLLSEE
jgi:HD-like signal output (HDOD) protein